MKLNAYLTLTILLLSIKCFSQVTVEITDTDFNPIEELNSCDVLSYNLVANAQNINPNTTITFEWIENATNTTLGNSETLFLENYTNNGFISILISSFDAEGVLFEQVSDAVEIIITQTPNVITLSDVFACESYVLPVITGTNLSGNEAYYTEPNGNSTSFPAGSTINYNDFASFPVTLYVYDETNSIPNCFYETSFSLTLENYEDSSFLYPNSTYAINGTNPIPIVITTFGGIFTINNGGTIDPSTGEIDLASTNVGQNYTIIYTTTGFCASSSSFAISIVESLNISTNILQNNLSIYPNPAKKYFKLKNESSIPLKEIEIIDYLGKIIKKVDLKNMSLEKQISIPNLNSGIYFIKISSEKYSITKKLIVN